MLVGAASSMVARTPAYRMIGDSLTVELGRVKTDTDSLRILSDLMDLRPKWMSDSIGKKIVHTAICSRQDSAGLDAIRNLANLHLRNDSLLQVDLDNVYKFGESVDRDETATFVRMMQNLNRVRFINPEEKETELRRLLRKASSGHSSNIYDEIVLLHAISLYIGETAQGDLLSKYMDKLHGMIEKLRPEAYAIRNCYYVQAALTYANNDECDKSIEADRKLLQAIEDMEHGRKGANRRYRSYDANRYVIYTRLLSNYPRLNGNEVEELYKGAMAVVATDSMAATTNRISMRPQIYYAMYKKEYAEALSLLKTYIDYPYNAQIRRSLLKMMIKCAEQTGDMDALLVASRNYNEILEKTIEDRTREKFKELQIVYDINQMKAESTRKAVKMQRMFTIGAVVASVVLLVLLLIVFLLWRHARKLTQSLVDSNRALVSESANLRQAQADLVKARDDARLANRIKSDFIKNMSGEVAVPLHTINEYTNLIIDCSEAGFKPYLKHFAELVSLNSELLTSIVNDVLNLSEIDSDAVSVVMKKEPLAQLCKMAVESVKHRVLPGVEIGVEADVPDVTVYTDPRRLMQILVQLLSNAAKFTKEGRIEVSFHEDHDINMAVISVTDTGIGVTGDNAERIFERFVKLDRSSQGVGIGLAIARHLAELMGGNVTLDTTYTNGARFLVTVQLG